MDLGLLGSCGSRMATEFGIWACFGFRALGSGWVGAGLSVCCSRVWGLGLSGERCKGKKH